MTSNPFDLTGTVALVTGSSRGIGAALAEGLVGAGATVVLNARDGEALEAARKDLAARTGATVHASAFDVTDDAAVAAAVAGVESTVGPIGVLVNNAGVQHRVPMLDLDVADWNRVLAANLTGPFLVGRAVARGMLARGTGKIVNIASVQARLARPGIAPYAASKGGIAMLTRTMCAEWGPSGVQANAIAPGYFDTVLTSALVNDPEFDAWVRGRTPARRWGRPEELVGTLLWLASGASDFVNGQVVHVDGGMTAVV
ncbi:SDR family oxidoreductase [Kineosporia sp. A_224]|uniref:SDR family oxidoreductase n=1 Tax=Kineosporia sp. A_224 TaxID=1962180 RepID=UPI000B4BB785|nr:SDR family oxidoreductase [Kineosporia sp. A_224]